MLFSIFCNVHGPFLLIFFSHMIYPLGIMGKKTKNIEASLYAWYNLWPKVLPYT